MKGKKPCCYNCESGGPQFKIGNMTNLHCEHPKYTQEDFDNGKLSAWDTLRLFYNTCNDHKFKSNVQKMNIAKP